MHGDVTTSDRRERPTRGGRAAAARADLPWLLLLIGLAVLVSVLGVLRAPTLSGLDEHTHLDYAWKVAHGQLPYAGATVSDEVLQEWACRGQDNIPGALPPCSDAVAAAEFPVEGENYNSWHPPLYYAVTGVLARAVAALPLGLEFVTAARLTGALWLAAGMAALYGVVRMWRAPRWLAAAAAALPAGLPMVAHAASTVTNDAPALLAGAGAAWVLTRAAHGRPGWLVPTVLALLIAGTKLMSTVAILTAVGVLALTAIGAARRGELRRARALVTPAVGVVTAVSVVAFGWSAFQGGRQEPGWSNPIQSVNTYPVAGLPFDEWAPTLVDAFGLVQDFYLQPVLASVSLGAVVSGASLLLTAAPLVGLAVLDRGDPARLVAWASLAGVLAVPLLVQGQELVRASAAFITVSPRYGITLIPLTVLALALVALHRRWGPAVAAVPAAAVGVLLLSFAGVL